MANTDDVVWKDGERGAAAKCRKCRGVLYATGNGPTWMRCGVRGAGHEYVSGGRDEDVVSIVLVEEP